MPQLPDKFTAGETLRTDIGPKLNRLVEFVRSLPVHGDGATTLVRRLATGQFISAIRSPGGGGGGGAGAQITAEVTARTGARAYTISLYSRVESDGTVSVDYRTATGEVMRTPHLNDTATADQIAVGRLLPVTRGNVGGTVVWVPVERVGML